MFVRNFCIILVILMSFHAHPMYFYVIIEYLCTASFFTHKITMSMFFVIIWVIIYNNKEAQSIEDTYHLFSVARDNYVCKLRRVRYHEQNNGHWRAKNEDADIGRVLMNIDIIAV